MSKDTKWQVLDYLKTGVTDNPHIGMAAKTRLAMNEVYSLIEMDENKIEALVTLTDLFRVHAEYELKKLRRQLQEARNEVAQLVNHIGEYNMTNSCTSEFETCWCDICDKRRKAGEHENFDIVQSLKWKILPNVTTPRYPTNYDKKIYHDRYYICTKGCKRYFIVDHEKDRKEKIEDKTKIGYYVCPCGAEKIVSLS